jgi:hypothetical protein
MIINVSRLNVFQSAVFIKMYVVQGLGRLFIGQPNMFWQMPCR